MSDSIAITGHLWWEA